MHAGSAREAGVPFDDVQRVAQGARAACAEIFRMLCTAQSAREAGVSFGNVRPATRGARGECCCASARMRCWVQTKSAPLSRRREFVGNSTIACLVHLAALQYCMPSMVHLMAHPFFCTPRSAAARVTALAGHAARLLRAARAPVAPPTDGRSRRRICAPCASGAHKGRRGGTANWPSWQGSRGRRPRVSMGTRLGFRSRGRLGFLWWLCRWLRGC